MKKCIFFLITGLLFLYISNSAYAGYEDDYTFVDCINGNDSTGKVFESAYPFATPKQAIEKTINTINAGTLKTTSGAIFRIKISCNFVRTTPTYITLNFYGGVNNNYLEIEGDEQVGFAISDTVFQFVARDVGNITFKNVQFIKNSLTGYYFERQSPTTLNTLPVTYGIKIQDSYIKLDPGTQIGSFSRDGLSQYSTASYVSQFYIYNSVIDIQTSIDYHFQLPALIKDSKIHFVPDASSKVYFTKQFARGGMNYATLVSNQIDLGGRKFYSQDGGYGLSYDFLDIAFINNKISNAKSFEFGSQDTTKTSKGIFLNNLIEGALVDISKNINVYNNVFGSGFIDISDAKNLRKNYTLDNIGPKGIGWIYKKTGGADFQLNMSSTSLYKEITGQDIPNLKNSIYLIYD